MSLDASNTAYSNAPTPVINRSRHSNTFSPVGASSARNDSMLRPTGFTTAAAGADRMHTQRGYMSPTAQRQWQDSGQFTPLIAQRYQHQQQPQQQFDVYSESAQQQQQQQQQVPVQFADVYTPLRTVSSSSTAVAGDGDGWQQRDGNAAAAHYSRSSSSSRGNMPSDAPVYTSDDTLLGTGVSPIQRIGSYRSSTTMRTAAADAAAAVAADGPVTPAHLRAAAGATAHYDYDSAGSDSSRYTTAAAAATAGAGGAATGGSSGVYSSITATPQRRVQFVDREGSDDGSSTATTTSTTITGAAAAATAGQSLKRQSTGGAATAATAAGVSTDAFSSPMRASLTAAGDAERSYYTDTADTAASAGTASAAVSFANEGAATRLVAGLQSFLSPQQRSTSIAQVSQQQRFSLLLLML
jgi:hypothetical protein